MARAVSDEEWQEAQRWELDWWEGCYNSYFEEQKQLSYLPYMGLKVRYDHRGVHWIDVQGASVLDIGGGPVSLLLKVRDASRKVVVDPLEFPAWVYGRYEQAGIEVWKIKAEDLPLDEVFDEVWIYNLLQHVQDPEEICRRARAVSHLIRVFEWVHTDITDGHPQSVRRSELDHWLGGIGQQRPQGYNGMQWHFYHGIFLGDHYKGGKL